MPTCTKNCLPAVFILFASPAFASHLVGDDFTYKYLGDTAIFGVTHHKYEVTLITYADCLMGQPEAIAQDNPAYFGVYSGTGALVSVDSIGYSSAVTIPALSSGPCGTGATPLCVLKKTFIKRYALLPSTAGYTIVYQRCCKNAALTNVIDPGDNGVSYFCAIPPSGTVAANTSAVFTNYPPLEIALNSPFSFDHSATDADGDSLSYELCKAYVGGTDANIKPFPPSAPPYDPVNYVSPLSYTDPMSCSVPLQIDPVSGVLTCTPNIIGRYLVTVCCNEWRGGVLINTVKREFEFAVIPMLVSTYQPFAGNDTSIYAGDSLQFSASGAATYSWTPGTYLSNPAIFDPAGYFPDPGIFTYILHGVSDSGCTGNDTINVNVLEHSAFVVPNGFTPNGDGVNDVLIPIPVKNSLLKSFKVYNSRFELLYSSTSPYAGWDGRYKGAKQDMGNYYWELEYQDNSGKMRRSTGLTTLIK